MTFHTYVDISWFTVHRSMIISSGIAAIRFGPSNCEANHGHVFIVPQKSIQSTMAVSRLHPSGNPRCQFHSNTNNHHHNLWFPIFTGSSWLADNLNNKLATTLCASLYTSTRRIEKCLEQRCTAPSRKPHEKDDVLIFHRRSAGLTRWYPMVPLPWVADLARAVAS
jgi:hypothetical protein